MPKLWIYNADGSKVTPNKNYLTDYNVATVNGKQTITMNFNPKAKWNDGTDIDWTAVQAYYTVQSGQNSDYTPASTTGWEQVESVRQGTSAKQAVITMKTPYYPPYSFIDILHPKAANVATYTNGWVNNPHDTDFGAGPYIIKSRSDSQITFTPNPKWWGDKPKMTTVTYKVLSDQAEINAFKNGEINAAGLSSADDIRTVKSVAGATIRRGWASRVRVFEINTKNATLKDIAVRKAFVQSINRKELAKIAFSGVDWDETVPGSELVYQNQAGYEDNMPKESAFNVKNAKATLEKAGYKLGSDGYYAKDGKALAFSYTTFGDDPKTKALGLAVQKMAKASGLKVSIDNKPSSDFSKTITSGSWDIVGMGWSSTTPDGFNSGYQLFGSDSESNYSFVGEKSVDEELKKTTSLDKVSDQIKQANKAEKKALALYGQFPYANGPVMGVYSKGLANYGPAGYQTTLVENIGWEK